MVRFVRCAWRLDGAAALILASFFALSPGCSRQEPIRRYEAPKEETADSTPDLGAMASGSGPSCCASLVACEAPEGWAPGEVRGLRKAAFVVTDGDQKVEITVIDLAASAGALLPNVNRWRQQIQLDPITETELKEAAQPIQVAGVEGRYVELLGSEDAKPRQAILGVVALLGEKAWFIKLWGDADLALREKGRFQEFAESVKFQASPAGGAPAASAAGPVPPPAALSPKPPPAAADSPLQYETPEGWAPGEVRSMRKAAFVVTDGDQKVEITAIDLPARAGDLLPNVNRWRQQIQLEPTTEAELKETARPIPVAGVEGQYVELLGSEEAEPRQAILGVVAVHEGKAWFFKLTGDAELALREKERFQGFVKSVKFAAADGAGHDD